MRRSVKTAIMADASRGSASAEVMPIVTLWGWAGTNGVTSEGDHQRDASNSTEPFPSVKEWRSGRERPNSDRSRQFARLLETVRRMGDFPAGHQLHISAETAKSCEEVLGLLLNNFQVAPPKMFPQDSESLTFTWDTFDIKRYLTVDGAEFDLLELNKINKARFERELPFDPHGDAPSWLLSLGGPPSSAAGEATKNAV